MAAVLKKPLFRGIKKMSVELVVISIIAAAVVIIMAAVGGMILTAAAINWAYRERW